MATKKTIKRPSRKKVKTLKERALAYLEDEQKLLDKYGLKKHIVVLFPHHDKPPMLGKLAVRMLKWSRAMVDAQFVEKNHG